MKNTVLIAWALVLFSSCVSTKVNFTSYEPIKVKESTKICLASVTIEPMSTPIFPLIDAAIFKGRVNKVASDIMNLEEQRVDAYQGMLVDMLKSVEIDVFTAANFNDIDASLIAPRQVATVNENFPVSFYAENSIMIADGSKFSSIRNLFSNTGTREKVKEMTEKLDVDYMMMVFNRLAITGVSSFGLMGALRLESYSGIYNRAGDLVAYAMGRTKPSNIQGNVAVEYEYQLDQFNQLVDLMKIELVKHIQ